MKNWNNKSWYSVILALLLIWFMLVLTGWVFWLVVWESKDTKSMESYFKAYAWAEWAVELAMLKSKEYSYSYDDSISNDVNNKSIILSKNPLDKSQFSNAKDVLISYQINAKSNNLEKDLASGEFDIIPLFFYDNNTQRKIKNIYMHSNSSELVWNIVWKDVWISWIWDFVNNSEWNFKILNWNELNYSKKYVWDFLNDSSNNYLILHNASNNTVTYNLKSLNSWEYFTNFTNKIIWSGEIRWFKQNLVVDIKSSEYLNLLKYSIFSN